MQGRVSARQLPTAAAAWCDVAVNQPGTSHSSRRLTDKVGSAPRRCLAAVSSGVPCKRHTIKISTQIQTLIQRIAYRNTYNDNWLVHADAECLWLAASMWVRCKHSEDFRICNCCDSFNVAPCQGVAGERSWLASLPYCNSRTIEDSRQGSKQLLEA